MADKPENHSRRRIVIPIVVGLAVLILAIGIPYLIYASRHVSTDDAQIDGNITTIAPKVKGQVTNITVDAEMHSVFTSPGSNARRHLYEDVIQSLTALDEEHPEAVQLMRGRNSV